jgi:hypothetical protein
MRVKRAVGRSVFKNGSSIRLVTLDFCVAVPLRHAGRGQALPCRQREGRRLSPEDPFAEEARSALERKP